MPMLPSEETLLITARILSGSVTETEILILTMYLKKYLKK